MIEILLFVLLGCLTGVFTGLIPGVHTNTIALFILVFAYSTDLYVVGFVVAMSVVQSFVDFIPSIVLGAPDSESFLSVLPGHRLLMKGLGLYALKLTAMGGLISGIASVALMPLFFLFIEKWIEIIYSGVPLILIGIILLMVFSEQQKLWAVICITLSAVLGVAVLRNPIAIGNPLFPLVTGFFGAATLIYALGTNTKIPAQKTSENKYKTGMIFSGSIMSTFAGALVSILPSVGAAQAAFLLRNAIGKISASKYLVILGGINTSNMIFSFGVLYIIGKTRTGAALAIKQMIQLTDLHLLMIMGVVLFAIGFGFFALETMGEFAVKELRKFDYRKINILVLVGLSILTVFMSGLLGVVVFLTATAIGLIPIISGIKRTTTMAFLMVPTMLIYLGI